MEDDGSWRTIAFRQSVVSKIEKAIRQSGINTSRTSLEMENHVFQKAKNKEEYFGYVARLIVHIREMNTKKGPEMGVPGTNQGGPGVPDLINALQALAIQGTCNPLMTMGGQQQGPMGPQQPITATNLLQNLNCGPAQAMNNMQQNLQPCSNMGMGPNEGPMEDDGSWRTASYRQCVITKIEETVQRSGLNTPKNSMEMEHHVFQKARNKEEYLGYVARLILYMRDMSANRGPDVFQGIPR